jgi:hypothetical protein
MFAYTPKRSKSPLALLEDRTAQARRRNPMHYRICIQGHLGPSWQERFAGLRLEQQEAGTTLLSGELPDQAALHGLLLQIVRLGLVLLSLEVSAAKGDEEAADRS